MQEKIPFIPQEELTPQFCISALSETEDWGLISTNTPIAWKFTKGSGVKIVILDTGVYSSHIDLKNNIESTHNCSSSTTEQDMVGHGTHCAGIVAAEENQIGIIGIAPLAKIISVKVLDDYGHASYTEIEKGIRLATALKPDIIGMSLGSTELPPQSLHDSIIDAEKLGIIFVAAAGNDGGKINYPALFPEVIAVCALDKDGNLASFSSHGNKQSFAAPGVNIYSCWLNNQYAKLSGTSSACPFICGIIALLLSWSRNTPGVKPINGSAETLQRLDDLCDDGGRLSVHDKDGNYGYGIPKFANFMPWKESEQPTT